MKNIVIGCGADELIDLLMRVIIEPGDKIIDCPPTFTMYGFDADVNNAQVIKIPRLEDFSLDMVCSHFLNMRSYSNSGTQLFRFLNHSRREFIYYSFYFPIDM